MSRTVLLIPIVLAQLIAASDVKPETVLSVPEVGSSIPSEVAETLFKARRIFVESFGESSLNRTLQAMIVDAMRSSGRFIVTENREKADLVLKGAAIEKTSQELHALGSSTAVAGASGGGSSSLNGTPGYISGRSEGAFHAGAAEISDAQVSTETIHNATVAVRLVSPDGDVVWSTTQESTGAKYKSATADVADKVAKQLARDLNRLKNN